MHGPFGVHALLFFCDGLLQGHMVNIVVVVIERPIEPAHCFDYDNEHWPACPLARVILNHASRGGRSWWPIPALPQCPRLFVYLLRRENHF